MNKKLLLVATITITILCGGITTEVQAKGPAYPNGTIVINPNKLTWTAYDSNGKAVKSGKALSGKKYCHDVKRACKTPSGHFKVWSKGSAGCKSSKYPVGKGGAPMPYCMFFSKYYAIHGSYDMPNHNASHGCVRVYPAHAAWLSRNFVKVGTHVIILPY